MTPHIFLRVLCEYIRVNLTYSCYHPCGSRKWSACEGDQFWRRFQAFTKKINIDVSSVQYVCIWRAVSCTVTVPKLTLVTFSINGSNNFLIQLFVALFLFSCLVLKLWNALPSSMVSASTLEDFKEKLADVHLKPP